MKSIESEEAIIGIVLNEPEALSKAMHLEGHHFSEAILGGVWEAIKSIYETSGQVDYRLVMEKCQIKENPSYIFDMWDKAPSGSLADTFTKSILNAWQIRELAEVTRGITGFVDAEQAMTTFKDHLARIGAVTPSQKASVTALQAARNFIEQLTDKVTKGEGLGLLTGLKFIDERLGGLQPGHLIVVGARPSQGKTTTVGNIILGAAKKNPDHVAAFFSFEMKEDEVTGRFLANIAFRKGDFIQYRSFVRPTQKVLERVAQHRDDAPENVHIFDSSRGGVDYIRRECWKLKAKSPISVIGIDYAQIMTLPEGRGKTDAKLYSDLTAELKRIADELETTVVLLSQLSRQVEQRDNKRPMLSDLRESGGFESDANVVFFPYRDVYYLQRCAPNDPSKAAIWKEEVKEKIHDMEMICAKNRGGEIGTDQMWVSMGYDIMLNEEPPRRFSEPQEELFE